jgi:release factor glutamine methyltransferase
MRDLQSVLRELTEAFQTHAVFQPRRQAEELLCDLLNYSRLQLYTQFERPIDTLEWENCQLWLNRRLKGEPLAYIAKQINFYDCSIQVNSYVLIPRQETEILVDRIIQQLQDKDLTGLCLLDLCCGSGCIGIALKKKFPALQVTLTDLSPQAIQLAQFNAIQNQVQVECLTGDLLAPLKNRKAHFVVCNPPYISESEYETLDKSVKNYEPRLALVGGKTGLEIYERLAHELPAYLYPQAKVWLEIGYQQGESIEKIFGCFPWVKQQLANDWAGQNRFFFLENE